MFCFCMIVQNHFLIYYPQMNILMKIFSTLSITLTAFFFLATILTSNVPTELELSNWKKITKKYENDYDSLSKEDKEQIMKEMEEEEEEKLNKKNTHSIEQNKDKNNEQQLIIDDPDDFDKEEKYRKMYIKKQLHGEEYYIKYCYFCEHKTTRWDHHCPIVGCDIGIRNHFYFVMMIFFFILTISFQLYYNFFLWKYVINFSMGHSISNMDSLILTVDTMFRYHFSEFTSSIVYVLFIIILPNFMLFHINLILTRTTTYAIGKIGLLKKHSLSNLKLCINESGSIDFNIFKKIWIEFVILILLIGIIMYYSI